MTTHEQLGVMILGAGASVRMGTPKLLLPWGDTTVLGHLVQTWRELQVRQIAVIVAMRDSPLDSELDRLGIPRERRVRNPDPACGMFGSIVCGASWSGWEPPVSHVALSLGDQPLVQKGTLLRLMEFSRENPASICQPTRKGRPRHPVIFPAREWSQLRESGVPTLRHFLESRTELRRFLECEDSGLDMDLDSPSDYGRALAIMLGGQDRASERSCHCRRE